MSDSFRETVGPIPAIRAILHDYPFSTTILRELLQNSDDARATKQVRHKPLMKHVSINAYDRFSFLTWGKTLHSWHTMILSSVKRIGRLSEPSMTHPREQMPRKIVYFCGVTANLFFSKIGKYGVGFRACYHVCRSTLLLATYSDAHIDNR